MLRLESSELDWLYKYMKCALSLLRMPYGRRAAQQRHISRCQGRPPNSLTKRHFMPQMVIVFIAQWQGCRRATAAKPSSRAFLRLNVRFNGTALKNLSLAAGHQVQWKHFESVGETILRSFRLKSGTFLYYTWLWYLYSWLKTTREKVNKFQILCI